MTSPSPCLTYAAIALAKAVEMASHHLGLHVGILSMLTELVILAAYIKLARVH